MQRPGGKLTTLDGETHAFLVHEVTAEDDGTAFLVTVTDGNGNLTTSIPARLKVLP
jgi:hypothetical protein